MSGNAIISKRQYLKKIINTFCPKILLQISPKKNWVKSHWKNQNAGEIHGYDNYCTDHPVTAVVLPEIDRIVPKEATILDIGCNCGYYLSRLKQEGYSHLTGIDICGNAINYGKTHLNLSDVEMITGSFEEVLPRLCSENRKFSLVYTVGATVELVHPSFDIIKYICEISDEYVVLIISLWGHDYPRFWEFEFEQNGFILVKQITPYDGNTDAIRDPSHVTSLLVFKRIQ